MGSAADRSELTTSYRVHAIGREKEHLNRTQEVDGSIVMEFERSEPLPRVPAGPDVSDKSPTEKEGFCREIPTCPTCYGAGSVRDGGQPPPCPTCDGLGEISLTKPLGEMSLTKPSATERQASHDDQRQSRGPAGRSIRFMRSKSTFKTLAKCKAGNDSLWTPLDQWNGTQ